MRIAIRSASAIRKLYVRSLICLALNTLIESLLISFFLVEMTRFLMRQLLMVSMLDKWVYKTLDEAHFLRVGVTGLCEGNDALNTTKRLTCCGGNLLRSSG